MDTKILDFDVVIVGGGTAGVPAAIASGRNGAKTLLVEKSLSLGGIVATGMPASGFWDRKLDRLIGGIPEEIVNDMKAFGESYGIRRCPIHNSIATVNGMWYRAVAALKCKEAGVEILYGTIPTDVKVVDGKVKEITLVSGSVEYKVSCKVIVDASGDAVAAYLAGAKYEMGQPEGLNAIIKPVADQETRYHIGHSTAGKVQPVSMVFSLGNVDVDAFYAYIKEHPETYKSPAGYGMHYDAAYFDEDPAFYFTGYWEFIEKAREAGDFDLPRDRVIFASQTNKGEFMMNCTRVVDVDPTDPLDQSRAITECYRQIDMLTKFFRKYCPGFENCGLTSIGPTMGIRESRRIVGKKTFGKELVDNLSIPSDTIALCGYNVDIHLHGVGLYFQPVESAVGIPYGCIVSDNIDGMMAAGRCISADSYGLGLSRSMGTCEALGQAAGTAAALSVEQNISPADLDVDFLRKTLTEQGFIVSPRKQQTTT